MFLEIKLDLLAYAVCNADYDKCMQLIEVSKWFASSRLYIDLDFKTGISLLMCISHSIARCSLKFSDEWLVDTESFYANNALATLQ